MLRRFLALLLFMLAPLAVRAEEPIRALVIDGNGAAGRKKGGDAYQVEAVLNAVKGFVPTVRDAAGLEKDELKKYPLVFLLNLPDLSDAARTKVEEHVKAGAGVAFFLGGKVKPAHYNRRLYRKGEGLFPVMLADKPTEPPKEKKELELGKTLSSHPTLYIRNPGHEVCSDIGEARILFSESVLFIDRHYPITRPKDGYPAHVQELIAFPNDEGLDAFREEARKLSRSLPVEDDKYKVYRPALVEHQRDIRMRIVFGKRAWELGDALDAFLEDKGDPEDADRPDLTEFWKKPEVKALRQSIAALRDKTRYSDPILVAAPFGKGRVVVCLTSAGDAWNNWADGLAAPTFVMLTANIAKYLTGGDSPTKEKPRR